MSDASSIFDGATIKFDGAVPEGPDGKPIEIFVVQAAQGPFWFEAYYSYAENEYDFWITVRNFGLRRKSAVGSCSPIVRRKFSAAEARAARTRLEALFLGPHDNPDLPFLPFRWGKSKCLGVNFPDGWVIAE